MNQSCPHCSSTETKWIEKKQKWRCQVCDEPFDAPAPSPISDHPTPSSQTLASTVPTPPSLSDKAAKPKRIFFSYGHDGNKELVDRFKADLEKRGHTVWIDYKEIGTWSDWKGSITRGIHDSEMAIAFLSIHSVRDPGVCRNEIAMALHHFGTVYPFLLEKVPFENIPVTISNLQWPDLSDWRDIRDGKVPGVDYDRFYEEKLLEIISRLEGDATRFQDETAVLRRVLRPSAFEGRFAQHLEGFIGRDWVFRAFDEWLEKKPESRVFWLKAGPGFGKTALAVNLANRYRAAIVGTWFCDSQSVELKDPTRALCTIAFQLALRWDDYRTRLLPRLCLFAGSGEAQVRDAVETLAKKNLSDLFSLLISEPLAGLIWREKKLVILLDALDEATEGSANPIAELVSGRFLELPEWISFVVTSRPDPEVVGHLQRFKPFDLTADDSRNTGDLEAYCTQAIGGSKALAPLDEAERKRLCVVLVRKSEGMILYLRLIEEGLREGSLAVDQLEHQEAGLPGLYSRYHQVFARRFAADYEEKIQPFLRWLLVSPRPLRLDLAAELTGWSKQQLIKSRSRIGSYLIEEREGLSFIHKTIADWLRDEKSAEFYTDIEGQMLLRYYACDYRIRLNRISRGSRRVDLIHDNWDGSLVDENWINWALQTTALRYRPKTIPLQKGNLGYSQGKSLAMKQAKMFIEDLISFNSDLSTAEIYSLILIKNCEKLRESMKSLGLLWTFGRSQKFFNILTKYWFVVANGYPDQLNITDFALVNKYSKYFDVPIDSIVIRHITKYFDNSEKNNIEKVHWAYNLCINDYFIIQSLIERLANKIGFTKISYDLKNINDWIMRGDTILTM